MDINNELKGFFENPFAGEYISCTDNLVRRSVTGISASCELHQKAYHSLGDGRSGL